MMNPPAARSQCRDQGVIFLHMAPPPPALAAALADRYRLEREIGVGGMARVYLAEDLKHRRKVALKVLHPELAAVAGVERFLQEIEITANLQHPHILALHDSGTVEGTAFYVMPFVEGETLRARLDREPQLPVADAIRIATAVASAIDYAHSRGVLHRDIKPENVLLSGGHAMVADFGIGKSMRIAADGPMTQTGMVVGTPAYMSPEQATGEPLDGRSDLYSLGVLLFEMLAGTVPFAGSSVMAILSRRLTETPPPLRAVRPAVSESLELAVSRALARDPGERFTTGAELVLALEAVLTAPANGQPVVRASIAVLPFANLSADPENAYFADGITEDIIAQLSKIRAMKVISKASVMAFKQRDKSMGEIAATLQVATLLDGSVRRAGNRVRIVAQLVDPRSGQNLWTETYDRDLTDIFAIQTEVALRIAGALQAELSAEERGRLVKPPTSDVAAYQFYLKGRHAMFRVTAEGLRTGIEYFEKAIRQDPGYALAWAGIAFAYSEMAGSAGDTDLQPADAVRRAKDAVARALEIDGDLGAARCIQAYLKFTRAFDWAGAERDFKRSIELDPGNADAYDLYGLMLVALERNDEALVMLERAQELDPLAHRTDVSNALLRAGRYEEALRVAAPAAEANPEYPRAQATLGWAYFKCGRIAEGLATLEHTCALSPDDTMFLAQLGQAFGLAGQPEQAREVLGRLEELSRHRYVSPYHFAYVFVGLGEFDRALDQLEQAYEERGGAIWGIKGSFLFQPLRSHPRFTALLQKMNLA